MAQSRTLTSSERSNVLRKHRQKHGMGYLFLLPALILYALFMLYPFVESIYLSLTDWNGVNPDKHFIGLRNYVEMLGDSLVWTSLGHNLIWVVIGTIAPIALGLFLAVLVSSKPRGFTLFRTVYFLPHILSPVIIGIIWGWIYNPLFGLLNTVLGAIGLSSLQRGWLGEPGLALYAVLAAAIWATVGFTFIIFLAGLQNVSVDLLEAAQLDGANAWQRFWNVTVPQLANVLTVVTTLILIGGFNVFDIVFIMTGGGPANSTELIATYTYKEAFTQNRVGYGAALAMLMTVISLVTAIVFIRIREREEA